MFDFQNIKHALLPSRDFFILGLLPVASVQVDVYIINLLHDVVVQQAFTDGSGLLILESNWFDANKGKFEVFVVYDTVQAITSTLDSALVADKILYYRKKGDFYCKSTETFVTGELPANRIHSIYHAIEYN